jgi:hypothetical protein
MSIINFDGLNCNGCPARDLRNKYLENAKKFEAMREEAFEALKVKPRLIILCESLPVKCFVYDRKCEYKPKGLRANLRNELVPGKDDYALFNFMNECGIWIVDCALCPLFKLENKTRRRHAATICLERHTISHIRGTLRKNPGVKLVAIFPSRCGFLRQKLPQITNLTVKNFTFSKLKELKELVNQFAPP